MTMIFERNFDRETELESRKSGGFLSEEALQEVRNAAYEAGRLQGAQEAEARMREAAETLRVQALAHISDEVTRLIAEREGHERSLESQLLDYAISIGEKVLPDLIQTRSHQHVISQIRRAVRMGLGSAHVRIRLSGPDLVLLERDLDGLQLSPDHKDRVVVEASEKLSRGDLEVEWDQGGLSYSFSAICDELLSLLRKTKPAPALSGDQTSTNREGGTP